MSKWHEESEAADDTHAVANAVVVGTYLRQSPKIRITLPTPKVQAHNLLEESATVIGSAILEIYNNETSEIADEIISFSHIQVLLNIGELYDLVTSSDVAWLDVTLTHGSVSRVDALVDADWTFWEPRF